MSGLHSADYMWAKRLGDELERFALDLHCARKDGVVSVEVYVPLAEAVRELLFKLDCFEPPAPEQLGMIMPGALPRGSGRSSRRA